MRITRTAGLAVLLSLSAACANAGDRDAVALRDPDGGTRVATDASIAMRVRAVPEERRPDPVDGRLACDFGFDPFLCQGDCPGGQVCCITALRPTGVCRTLDGCVEQCELDCGIEAMTRGVLAGMRCESLCTWLAPEPRCDPGT